MVAGTTWRRRPGFPIRSRPPGLVVQPGRLAAGDRHVGHALAGLRAVAVDLAGRADDHVAGLDLDALAFGLDEPFARDDHQQLAVTVAMALGMGAILEVND